MAADKARISFNPARQYRKVVRQQGRVTLEADSNESQHLDTEETRLHALDFVGPVGTPNDNNDYRVSLVGGDIQVQAGTMYVGGLRLRLESNVLYSNQSNWTDAPFDPLFRPVNAANPAAGHVLLHVREQEITAVEDPALREVALGGPDTAARTRMLQRVVLAPSAATTCDAALTALPAFWTARGQTYSPATAELQSRSRLQVTMVTTAPSPSPCDPPAQSGYLGADNQLIRVQVTSFNPATGTGTLLWSYNNASTLYRCRALDNTTLELATGPVSIEQTPRAGQAVQVLFATADLGEGAPGAALDRGAFVAALTGHVATLGAPFQPDTRRVTLPAALPVEFRPPALPPDPRPASGMLFLRLWETQLNFTVGAPVELPGTGLAVTITTASGGPPHIGDYWSIAARPTTPNAVYPERYLTAAQPPDGPREWVCPLAVIQQGSPTDCRVPFDNLPELTARRNQTCCCVTVRPADAANLQAIIDALIDPAGIIRVVVEFEPGNYALPGPLRFSARHRGVTLEACTGKGVRLSGLASAGPRFSFGMIVMAGARDITLRGLAFDIPPAPTPGEIRDLWRARADALGAARIEPANIAIGVQLVATASVSIEDCEFRFARADSVFGAAIVMRGAVADTAIRRSTVIGAPADERSLLTGVLAAPLVEARDGQEFVLPRLEALTIEENRFGQLSAAVLLAADCKSVAVRSNVSKFCRISFVLLNLQPPFRDLKQITVSLGRRGGDPGFFDTQTLVNDFLQEPAFSVTLALSMFIIPIEGAGEIRQLLRDSARPTTGPAPVFLGPEQIGVVIPSGTAKPPLHTLTLDLSANEFDSRVAPESSLSVMVWDAFEAVASTAAITGNRVWSRSPRLPSMMAILVESFNVTGNVIINDIPRAAPSTGQTPGGAGSLTGNVLDVSGAVLPNVTVSVVNIATGVTTTAVTNAQGVYTFPSLVPGEYRMTVAAVGFGSSITPVVVAAGQSVRQDIRLTPGQSIPGGGPFIPAPPARGRLALWVVPGGRESGTISPINLPPLSHFFTATGNTMTGASNLRLWVRGEWANRLPANLAPLLTWEFFNSEN